MRKWGALLSGAQTAELQQAAGPAIARLGAGVRRAPFRRGGLRSPCREARPIFRPGGDSIAKGHRAVTHPLEGLQPAVTQSQGSAPGCSVGSMTHGTLVQLLDSTRSLTVGADGLAAKRTFAALGGGGQERRHGDYLPRAHQRRRLRIDWRGSCPPRRCPHVRRERSGPRLSASTSLVEADLDHREGVIQQEAP